MSIRKLDRDIRKVVRIGTSFGITLPLTILKELNAEFYKIEYFKKEKMLVLKPIGLKISFPDRTILPGEKEEGVKDETDIGNCDKPGT